MSMTPPKVISGMSRGPRISPGQPFIIYTESTFRIIRHGFLGRGRRNDLKIFCRKHQPEVRQLRSALFMPRACHTVLETERVMGRAPRTYVPTQHGSADCLQSPRREQSSSGRFPLVSSLAATRGPECPDRPPLFL